MKIAAALANAHDIARWVALEGGLDSVTLYVSCTRRDDVFCFLYSPSVAEAQRIASALGAVVFGSDMIAFTVELQPGSFCSHESENVRKGGCQCAASYAH